jgi:hypothetical protein
VTEHPQIFASLTAPSFGPVHGRPDDGRPCRCGKHHRPDEVELGEAIGPDAYDYEDAVLRNWHAPGLWNRFCVELVRVLAAGAGLSEREWRGLVRVAYSTVAEFQARGLVHFHAIVRLDGAEDRAMPPGVVSRPMSWPPQSVRPRPAPRSSVMRVMATRSSCASVSSCTPASWPGMGDVCAEQVAAYIAKYSCKASHERITNRDSDPDRWRDRGVPEQLVQMALAAIRLSQRPGLRGIGGWCTCSASAGTS